MKADRLTPFCLAIALVILVLPLPAFAQQSDTVVAETEGSAPTKSGFTEGPSLEMGDSVTEDLAVDDVDVGAVLRFPRFENFFQPWFDWKKRLNEKYGLKLQFSYQGLYQEADETLTGVDIGAAGRGEFQGTWTLVGRNTKNPGLLSFRVENRHAYGSKIPPTQLGSQFGSATQTGSGFSDFGTAVTEVAWRQTLLDGDLQFVAGKISGVSWYNAFSLSSAKRGFQNLGLRTSLSKPGPGRGLGGGFAVRLGEQFVALAGIHDANARTPDNPFDTIDEKEFYYSAEFRWFPTTFDRRRFDQVRVQIWHQDERTAAGIPSDQGITFVASRLFNDAWMPFVFGGVSDGKASIYEADLVAGVAFAFNTVHRAARDALAFAVGWGRPADDTLREQWTSEVFYRFQLVERLAITPSAQYIVNPASNPSETEVWVLGLRGRLTF
ncbi:MAG: carbohydrate porin [Arenicellales bacterium]|nr:carbohydrate porin [Arenicellales bacterium]